MILDDACALQHVIYNFIFDVWIFTPQKLGAETGVFLKKGFDSVQNFFWSHGLILLAVKGKA